MLRLLLIVLLAATVVFATGCRPSGYQISQQDSQSTLVEPDDGLSDEQISAILAENKRVLGSMPETDEQTEWTIVETVECKFDNSIEDQQIDREFSAKSTWRIRHVSGGNCVVRTTPVDAYNGWYAFGGLASHSPTTEPNKNPGTHSLNVSLFFDDCVLVVETANE